MYQRNDFLGGESANSAALTFDAKIPKFGQALRAQDSLRTQAARRGLWHELDLVVDLGSQIGSKTWWRGALTCAALCGTTFLMAPSVEAIPAMPAAMSDAQWDEARAQAITPLAYGGDTGRRMAATDAVEPLADTPERPRIEIAATLGRGDSFGRVLERSGVSRDDAAELESMIAQIIPLSDIQPGTVMNIVLGRRPNRTVPRPV
ncbi:MAG: M23 family peptidase, partial [Sphingomonadaceae bacterium]|nr:M23 family peptidase [Sphingomonadaceae bacterium]